MQQSTLELVLQAGPVVKAAIILLLFFSVVSWAIIFSKFRYLSVAQKETDAFFNAFNKAREADELFKASKRYLISPIANVFRSVFMEAGDKSREELRRALNRYEVLEANKLEQYLSFLATTGSTTPFIGLFGTVWGIMNAFRSIGTAGSASLAVVAPGIAEALVATAIGLVAAIPAVIAYNYYLSRTRRMIVQMEDFSEEVLDLFDKGTQ